MGRGMPNTCQLTVLFSPTTREILPKQSMITFLKLLVNQQIEVQTMQTSYQSINLRKGPAIWSHLYFLN